LIVLLVVVSVWRGRKVRVEMERVENRITKNG
jgi:hypothetical protein